MKFREFIAVTRCAVAIQKQVSPHSNLPSSFSWCDWIAEQRHPPVAQLLGDMALQAAPRRVR